MPHLTGDSPERNLPQVGMEVAGYRLEMLLGKGGQGTVFRARREDRLFAVKFISLRHSAHWAWRELDVMVKLWHAGGLSPQGHGLWPAREPRFLFLVTPFVSGLPLDVWARVNNPHALEVTWLGRQGAQLLEVVHSAGVIHRDVKGSNLLVGHDGQLVLVDFGVATYEGAPVVTGPVPPGTWPYLSPRVWRSWRGEEESRASPDDDLWALGVELYRLLTGRLPFLGSGGELVHAILHEEPPVPHELNPRVPRALGEVCWRMLRKRPEERFAGARGTDEALEKVEKQADGAWKVPLCEQWSPHHATTVELAEMWRGGDLMALHERRASYELRPVRGRPLAPDEASTQGAEIRADEARADAPPLAAPIVESAAPPASTVAPAKARRVLQVTGALLVLMLAGLGVWLAVCPPPRASAPVLSPVGTPRAILPPEFHPISLEPIGQEVAPPWRRLEGDVGAAPEAAATPAPVARATPPKDTRVKTPAKTSAPQQQKPQPKETSGTVATVGAIALTCTLATGCPGPTTTAIQARPLPPPAECPPDSVRTMKELGFRIGKNVSAEFPNQETSDQDPYTPVREGPGMTMRIDETGTTLPNGTIVSGELFFGTDRIHGRFTRLHTPDGHTYPVCMMLVNRSNRVGVGGEDVKPGEKPGTALISWSEGVMAVERFE